MRWVFYALFLGNIGFFAFGFLVLDPKAELQFVEPSPIAQGVLGGRVVLLHESGLANAVHPTPVVDGAENINEDASFAEESVPVSEVNEEAPTVAPKCFRIGPFGSDAAADAYQLKIGFNDGFARVEEQPVAIDSKFWVYVPSAPTKEDALATLRSLQVAGVDSFVVLKGQFQNAVSLGTFKKLDSAEVLKERVASLGYTVDIDKQESVRNTFWLYLKALETEQQKAIETPPPAGVNLSVFSCEMFAQDKIFP